MEIEKILLPCPFCGSLNLSLYDGHESSVNLADGSETYSVRCDCNAEVNNKATKHEAIESWNKRVNDAIEFAEWINNNEWKRVTVSQHYHGKWYDGKRDDSKIEMIYYSSEELYKKFKSKL